MINSQEIMALSNDAQAVLAGHWMMGKKATLTMQNQKTRLSERGLAAITELVDAGIIRDEKADDGFSKSRIYRLTEKGAALDFRKSLKWMDKHGKFSIVDRIDDQSN